MEVIKPNETPKINVMDIPIASVFEFQNEQYIRIALCKTVLVDDAVLENVFAVNLNTGLFLLHGKNADAEVFAVPLPTAKVVVE